MTGALNADSGGIPRTGGTVRAPGRACQDLEASINSTSHGANVGAHSRRSRSAEQGGSRSRPDGTFRSGSIWGGPQRRRRSVRPAVGIVLACAGPSSSALFYSFAARCAALMHLAAVRRTRRLSPADASTTCERIRLSAAQDAADPRRLARVRRRRCLVTCVDRFRPYGDSSKRLNYQTHDKCTLTVLGAVVELWRARITECGTRQAGNWRRGIRCFKLGLVSRRKVGIGCPGKSQVSSSYLCQLLKLVNIIL